MNLVNIIAIIAILGVIGYRMDMGLQRIAEAIERLIPPPK